MSAEQKDPRTPVRGSFRTLLTWCGFAAVLAAAAALAFREVLADPASRVTAANDDTSLFIWWFAHAADSVASWFGAGTGEGSLLTTVRMNHPEGVNGAWNTSVLGLAVPAAPLTWLLGPVVSFNLCILASPVAAGLACGFLLRRFAAPAAAFPAAFLYAFSPYLISQAGGHLNLSFAVLPPLVAAFLHSALTAPVGGRFPERVVRLLPAGVLLAAALVWQFYLSTELLAGTFLAAVTALLVLACVFGIPAVRSRALRRGLVRRLGPAALVAGGAGAIALLVAAPLLATMAADFGAPREGLRPHGVWVNDLADAVVPPSFVPFGAEEDLVPRVLGIDPAEVGGYLSAAWLLVAVWAVLRTAGSRCWGALTRTAAGTAACVWLLSMGGSLRVAGADTGLPGPFRLVESLPVLENVLPMRLAVHVVLCLSILTAVLLESVRTAQTRRRTAARVCAVLGACATAASLAPIAVEARTVPIPALFTSGELPAVIPEDSVVKAVPQPRALAEPDAAQSMVWQAVSGMRYSETGGYFIGSTPEIPVIYQSPLDPLDQALRTVEDEGLEAVPPEDLAEAVADSARRGTDFLLVPRDVPRLPADGDALALRLAEASGAEESLHGGVWVLDLRHLR
ncbi:hypothetical protein [Brevibacterium sp.]|uniref:hypothetical protein n=1 Tax=Brevibacterium sp. TaxID=1701 RepID=UPI0025BE5A38|nr:hypothetical protein [Brevibacterium sp.]